MKTQFAYCSFLLCLLLPLDGFAIYDRLAIDIKPTAEDVTFCFKPDYSEDVNTYLAAQVGSNFFFIPHLAKQPSEYVLLTAGMEPPVFAKKGDSFGCTFPCPLSSYSYCVGPFPKTLLQGISIYAGLGTSLTDVTSNPKNYAKIFDGNLITLPLQSPKVWTVMVYMVGADLESLGKNGSQDLLEMLAGTSQPTVSETVNVVLTTGGSIRYGWQTVKRSAIQHGQQSIIDDVGAKNMAAPQTLSDFVSWAKTNFPAQHYALILWDHGSGTQGYGIDTSDVGKKVDGKFVPMSLPELRQAFQTIFEQDQQRLDVVAYDACLMSSIEVAEVTATVAKAMAASVEIEPPHGFDYTYLLKTLAASPPADGLAFGRLAKASYFKQAQDTGRWVTSPITYSIFDLTKLPAFTTTFSKFTLEFRKLLDNISFLNYKTLSQGIIRAPGYPFRSTGQLPALRSSADSKVSANNVSNVRIDLYNVLQTVLPDFPQFKTYADDLLAILNQMIEYDANDRVKTINAQAGRVSVDIGEEKTHLATLPEAYQQLSEAFDYYNQRKLADIKVPDNSLVCPQGAGEICAFAQWLKLPATEVLGIDGYYGQGEFTNAEIYLIQSLYQRQGKLTEDLTIGVKGQDACQYQLCVGETHCENLTVTAQYGQLLADIQLNQSPAILSFCQNPAGEWTACSVVQQTNGIWGRDDILHPNDQVTPTLLHFQEGELDSRPGQALTVQATTPVLKTTCDTSKAIILAAFYGLNSKRSLERLCDQGECVCRPEDTDAECRARGMKAGIYIRK
jgi:hypothetical protein